MTNSINKDDLKLKICVMSLVIEGILNLNCVLFEFAIPNMSQFYF